MYSSKTTTGLQAQLILCGSVGTLCFLLFCFLRVRHAPATLPNSFFGWILPLIRTPNEVVLEKVGLDAVVMLQFLLMGFKLFSLCAFFGIIVLYPVSKMGGDLSDPIIDPEQPGNSTITTNSRLSMPDTLFALDLSSYSPTFLWVYLFFTYFFCFATFYFTFMNYRDYVYIRREFLLRTAKTIPSRTIIVTGIPTQLRTNRKLAEYFEKLGIGVVESVHIIRHVDRLLEFIKERAQYLRRLEAAYADYWGNPCHDNNYNPEELLREAERDQSLHALDWSTGGRKRPMVKDGFMGFLGQPVDAIQFYTEKFNAIDEVVLKARKHGKFIATNVGFVTYEDTISASVAAQVLIASTPFLVRVSLAPEPRDVLWENIAMHERERVIRQGIMRVVILFLVFFWVIPISYFSALTNEDSLRNYFPWLMKLAEKNKILQQIVQGFLPTLGVNIFMAILPLIFNVKKYILIHAWGMLLLGLSVIEGFSRRSEAEESTFKKHFFFLMFNVLLVFTLTSTLFKTLKDMLEDPTKIANILATSLPQVAPFFVNYTVLQGIMLLPIQLLQIGPVFLQLFYRAFLCKTPRDYSEVLAPRMYNYSIGYPIPVFLFVVLLVYSTISPLILVFGAIYYALAYLVFKYQLLYVYFHPYEVAGRMWPLVFSRIITGLLLFELTSSGLFVLKRAYPLALLCIPLILLTILFKLGMDAAYQRNTQFLPLQMLSDRFGPMSTVAEPLNKTPIPHTSFSQASSHHKDSMPLRRRRTVLDEDDYEAEPQQYTDFKEPPMTLLDGILNTGMKQYGHPALLGVLPQLWLPIKAGSVKTLGKSILKSFQYGYILDRTDDTSHEQQPLLGNTDVHSRGIAIQSKGREITRPIVREESETEDEFEVGTYYHHPERRHSRTSGKVDEATPSILNRTSYL
ncbi:hypothetical protein BDF14DRAFT_1875829 [Spinellus fusiger]|nr:hypothetical protein BDF14DRAFT_1875829 [Spinellus fusiger]